ncbi:MAG: hypothetical protein ACJ0OP_02225 [Thermodesulfobacteriota bacterium]|nr:MAG: hypothetical protein EVA31_01620 [Candidatus Dadabacteria bacterium]
MNKKEFYHIIDKISEEKKQEINNKISAFSKIKSGSNNDIFAELVFTILAAGTSAQLALNTTNILVQKNFVFNASLDDIVAKLKSCYRFYNVRGKYIYNTREYLRDSYNFNFHEIFRNIQDPHLRRSFFSSDKRIQGVGMKAASHFLRNIGFDEYAILDKHIINLMKEVGYIENDYAINKEESYLYAESILKSIAKEKRISLPVLDLALWFYKTGKIIK